MRPGRAGGRADGVGEREGERLADLADEDDDRRCCASGQPAIGAARTIDGRAGMMCERVACEWGGVGRKRQRNRIRCGGPLANAAHPERHSRARAARGDRRREGGGRTDGARGGRKRTPRTAAVWGRAATSGVPAIKICARRASKRRGRDERVGRDDCGGARRRAGGEGGRPRSHGASCRAR